jgi:Tfp pilus assembly protein PilX
VNGRHHLHRFADERGQSLVLTLLLMTFLAIALGTVIFVTARNQSHSNLQKAQQQAASLAEAGVNNGVSVLSNPNNQGQLETATLLPGAAAAYQTRYSSGTPTSGCVTNVPCVKWWGTLDVTNEVWTLHGKATVPNPTGAAAIVKTMSAQVQVNPPSSNSFSVGVWNSVYSPGTGQLCDTSINQGVTINIPLYVGGNLCMANQGGVNAPVYVGGNLNISNKQAWIGCAKLNANNCTTPAPVNSAHVGGWCEGPSSPQYSPCKSEPVSGVTKDTNIYVTNPATWNPFGVASDFAGITAPKICWSGSPAEVASGACTNQPPGGWYTFASPGPMHPCNPNPGPANGNPVFDNNGAMDRSVATVFNLTPATSYSCTTQQGQLSWNAGTNTLTVVGTIFFDGSITMTTTGNQPIQYTGIGPCTANGSCQSVIYASGDISVNGEMLCAVIQGNNCDWSNWNPNAKLLIFASDGLSGVSAGPSQTSFQGGLYAVNTVTTGQSALTEGPIVSGTKTVVLGQQFGGTFPPITIAPFAIQQQPGGFTINPPTNFQYGS